MFLDDHASHNRGPDRDVSPLLLWQVLLPRSCSGLGNSRIVLPHLPEQQQALTYCHTMAAIAENHHDRGGSSSSSISPPP